MMEQQQYSRAEQFIPFQPASMGQQHAGSVTSSAMEQSVPSGQEVKPDVEPSALAQRLKQLMQQRSDTDKDITLVVTHLLEHTGKQNESCQSLASRLQLEKARADSAEQTAAELKSSLKQQMDSAAELGRLQDALSKARIQANTSAQQVVQARKAQNELERRLQQLEEELAAARENAAQEIGKLQHELHVWKDLYYKAQPPQHHMHFNPPHLPPHGLGQPGDGPFPNMPPHAVPPPHMNPQFPGPMPMWPGMPPMPMWGPPPGLVHTPLPPQQPITTPTEPAARAAEPPLQATEDREVQQVENKTIESGQPAIPTEVSNASWSSTQSSGIPAVAAEPTDATANGGPQPVVDSSNAQQDAASMARKGSRGHYRQERRRSNGVHETRSKASDEVEDARNSLDVDKQDNEARGAGRGKRHNRNKGRGGRASSNASGDASPTARATDQQSGHGARPDSMHVPAQKQQQSVPSNVPKPNTAVGQGTVQANKLAARPPAAKQQPQGQVQSQSQHSQQRGWSQPHTAQATSGPRH